MSEDTHMNRLFEYIDDLASALEGGNLIAVGREAYYVVQQAKIARYNGWPARKGLRDERSDLS